MRYRARTGAVGDPRVEVDERGPDQFPVFERSVPARVRLVDGQLNNAGQARVTNERIDDETPVVSGLDVWRRRRVECATVDS